MSHRQRRFACLLLILALGLASPAAASGEDAPAAEPVRYELRFDKPNTHLLDITIHATVLRGPAAEFAMPAWTPGAYEITDYAKMVQEFRATGPDGKPLPWRKADKQTWRVELAGARAVTVRYKLYGNTLRNNWVQYNDQHAFLSGPAAWMYLVGGKQRPVELTIDPPAGWKTATGLRRTGASTFAADDYDWFIDSPIEISDYAEQSFTHAGTTYRVIVHDILGRQDFSRITRDARKIVEAMLPVFEPDKPGRPAPFDEYWFLFHIWPGSTGGLEHLNSTQINYGSDWDSDAPAGRYGDSYGLKLFVLSHEFFHVWNVKRLRPRELGPFDYSREVHTPSLWISEGVTSYYGQLALVWAGLLSPQDYLDSVADLISDFENHPGRRERSIEDTSWDTWFESNAPGDTNLDNTYYSYYDGGQILGHLLDFAIRHHTGNRKSLDDWMRLLYRRHALPKPGFTPEEAVRAASEVAGMDLSDFFRRYASGKEPLPYEEYFAYAGITVEKKTDPNRLWLGASFSRDARGAPVVANIVPGSPAQQAGLDRGDAIAQLDGKDVSWEDFFQRLSAKRPGDRVEFTVQRLGKSKKLAITLAVNPAVQFSLKPMKNPTDQQRRIYSSWIGKRQRIRLGGGTGS